MSQPKIRVLVVDDSALMRRMISQILDSDPRITVVGTAQDPYIARDKIKQLNPDVLTLDIEMPRMNGISFLRNLMRLRPMPVIMISSLTQQGADITLEALEIGAVDFIPKPDGSISRSLDRYANEIITKVVAAAGARLRADSPMPSRRHQGRGNEHTNPTETQRAGVPPRYSVDTVIPAANPNERAPKSAAPLIVIGSSTGGTEAVRIVLKDLPATLPPILIVQHIPQAFSTSFAQRLDRCSAITVFEAQHDMPIEAGHAYVAPGDSHLFFSVTGRSYRCQLSQANPVNRHRPSVDVLFRVTAQKVGRQAVGIILTGMGDDGARCMREMRDAGSYTIAQDEATSVVWGMPGAAVQHQAVQSVLPLDKIAASIVEQAQNLT